MTNVIVLIKNLIKLIAGQDKDSIKGRLAFSMSWALIGAIFSRTLVMIANIIFGRILGASQLGELGIIQNTINVFCVIASSGISQGITKYVAQLRSEDSRSIIVYIRTGLLLEVGLGLIGICILIVLSPILSGSLSSTTNISFGLVLFAFTVLFVSINNVQIAALSGFEKFETIALINGIRGILILTLGVWGGLTYFVNGAIIGLECAELITMMLGFFLLNKYMQQLNCYGTTQQPAEPLWRLVKFGAPSMIGSIVTMVAFWFCALLLTRFSGYGAMGIFNAADKWKQILIFIPTAVSPTVLPILSNLSNDNSRYKKVYRANLILNMVIIVIPTSLIMVFSKFAMGLYGSEFVQGGTVLILLVLSSVFSVLNNVVGQSLISLGAINTRTVLDIILAILVVGSAITLIPSYGPEGLALSYFIGYLFTSIIVFWITNRKLLQIELI